ncbi:MAG: hypothetical protein CMP65_04200 [Flavobacteriales bacterium]|nr:hypothetical protein [Flavobacteriales bacterium]|tara:strand:- start:13975 stop:15483 length:1509 start_codon:yes stop_codon:yes gene_type:complete
MIFKKARLSQQIFISMIALISFSMLIIAIINIQQIQKDTKKYNIERLNRKDRAVAKSIEAIINLSSQYNVDLETAFKPILKDVGYIHKLKINIYDLTGKFVWSSDTTLLNDPTIINPLSQETINKCLKSENKKTEYEKGAYFGTYRILYKDNNTKHLSSSTPIITDSPFCVLDVVYDKSTQEDIIQKTNEQIVYFLKIYVLLLLLSIVMAYFLQQRITSPLRSVSRRLLASNVQKKMEPLVWPVKDEIGQLIDSYNNLMKELNEKTKQLIQSEKEGAWKKMARQIAHEIKNPLTPMRLSVQYLQKSFNDGQKRDLYSDEWSEKLDEFTSTMIQQIDTLTRIANAFSDFASLSAQREEQVDIVKEVREIIHLFKNNNVHFIGKSNLKSVKVLIDKTHLTRVLNNLIQNSLQASKNNEPIQVKVDLVLKHSNCVLLVADNGTGIPKEIQSKIFEPNFTTKNSGMGLGLAMVKKIMDDLKGKISYSTSERGTEFRLVIPIKKQKI